MISTCRPASIELSRITGSLDHAAVAVDRRLAVEVDRGVDDAAAVLQGVGRRIGPAAAEFEARGRAAPDGFVGAQGVARARVRGHRAAQNGLVQLAKRFARVSVPTTPRRSAAASPSPANAERMRASPARREILPSPSDAQAAGITVQMPARAVLSEQLRPGPSRGGRRSAMRHER